MTTKRIMEKNIRDRKDSFESKRKVFSLKGSKYRTKLTGPLPLDQASGFLFLIRL